MNRLPYKQGHLAALDGLRGLAAFAVLAHHSRNSILDFHFGYLAVDFFFILSGYVIGLAYERRLECGLNIADYVVIRLERLYPMILFGALVGLIAVQVTPADGYFIPKDTYSLSVALLAQILLVPSVVSQGAFFINVPQWSIVFEVAVNILHAVLRRWLSNFILGVLLTFSAVAMFAIGLNQGQINFGWGADNLLLGVPRVLFGFFAGLLLYRTKSIWAPKLPVAPFWSLGVVLLALLGFPQQGIAGFGGLALEFMSVFIFFPLIVALGTRATSGGWFSRGLGIMSYPLYSIHQPLLYLAVFAMKVGNVSDGQVGILAQTISTLVILGLAYVIGRFIDDPWNRWRKNARQSPSHILSSQVNVEGQSATVVAYPNFRLIKAIAALTVAFSASILIATGSDQSDPLRATGLPMGVYGVFALGIVSGFLTSGSAWRGKHAANFLSKRFWRLMPAFVVSTLIITYLICPFFSASGSFAFIQEPAVLKQISQIIFFHTDKFYFSEVTFYHRGYDGDFLPGIANAALWPIRIQAVCYLIIASMMALSMLRNQRPIIAMLTWIWLAGLSAVYFSSGRTSSLILFILPSFCCGAFMDGLIRYHKLNGWIAALSAVGLIVAAYFGILQDTFCYFAAYPIVWLGMSSTSPLSKSGVGADVSYGIYLYGWPVAQLAKVALGPSLGGYEMAAVVLPLATACGWLSWYFIENPLLRWRSSVQQPPINSKKEAVPAPGKARKWIRHAN